MMLSAMGVSPWILFSLCFISQYAIWNVETGEQMDAEELLPSSHPWSQMFDNLTTSGSWAFAKLGLGAKCGIRPLYLESEEEDWELGMFSRIIGGKPSLPGAQPWQVSIKLGHSHFCGGSLIHDNVVVTAAHCIMDHDLKVVKNLIVTVGEYDLRSTDEGEQNIPVSRIVVHPAFNRFGYMDSDVALLYLKYRVKYGLKVQPICLPHKKDIFEAGTLCIVSGWGRVSEDGVLSNILQEVDLPIIDSRTCSELLKELNVPPMHNHVLCAGFPDGGKDACKGDSGGPLACRTDSGLWTLVGITSWGIGCAEDWHADKGNKSRRGSPGIFSKVDEVLGFIAQNIASELTPLNGSPPRPEDCSSQGILVFGESGHIQYPPQTEDYYLENSLCIWNITVPENNIILVQFIRVDIEDQLWCNHDNVIVYSSKRDLVGKICGNVLPSPLLVESNQATVTFVSDSSITGGGFEFLFSSVPKASEAGSGCGSVAVLTEEGTFDTANYPGLYPSNTKCHWLIEAPEEHVIKFEFEDFAVEISQDCIYDAVVIYDDTEEEHQIALLCGFSIPSPIWSSGNIMLIHFESDGENNFRGFKARFGFFPSETFQTESTEPFVSQLSEPKNIPLEPKIGNSMKYSDDFSLQLIHCRDVILTDKEGIIRSPGFPYNYSNVSRCHWRIVAPLNTIIRLDFLDFVFQKSHSKCHGGLIIYEGFGSMKEVLGNYCKEPPQNSLKSRGSVVMLTFSSSEDTSMKGFVLTYKTHQLQPSPKEGRIRNAGKGCPILDLIPLGVAEIVSPNYPNTYPDLLACTWTIYSASGNKVKGVIKDMVIEDTRDCIWDSLSFYDGPDEQSELLGQLCGRRKDLRLFSSGSYLTVHFKTDGSVGARGFKVFFEEVDHRPVQRSKSGIELKDEYSPGKLIASEKSCQELGQRRKL